VKLSSFPTWWRGWKRDGGCAFHDALTAAERHSAAVIDRQGDAEDSDDERLRDLLAEVAHRTTYAQQHGDREGSELGARAMRYLCAVAELTAAGMHAEALAAAMSDLDGAVAVARMEERQRSAPRRLPQHLRVAERVLAGGSKGADAAHGDEAQRIAEVRALIVRIRALRRGGASYTKATDTVADTLGVTGRAVRKRLGPSGKMETTPRK
jgi:hypothetical protein